MSNLEITFKEIRSLIIKGIFWQFCPIIFAGFITPFLEKTALPEAAIFLSISLPATISFFSGYIICWDAADKYARYKGYKNYFRIYSILNIFGLSILFLLKNRGLPRDRKSNKNSLLEFSISSILISYIAIPLLLIPFAYLAGFFINGEAEFQNFITTNKVFENSVGLVMSVFILWYFTKELRRANLNYQHILGNIRKIEFKLPLILTILKYFFSSGINSTTLYSLSFVFPKYVEAQINHEYATTIMGYVFFAIFAIIFAPITEEFFFRGIVFQKLALTTGIVKATLVSAIAFALIHFRYDVIPLVITGILYVILYFKTKQLTVPILAHFFYNTVAVSTGIYNHFFSKTDSSLHMSVVKYQQHFVEHWQWSVLYVALSAPYLGYFIYKNFPRDNDIRRLPYFANQQLVEH